jgi:threonine dehydratase
MYQPHQRHHLPSPATRWPRASRSRSRDRYHLARSSALKVDDIVLVTERIWKRGLSLLLQIEKTVVEGAGAAGLAALLAHPSALPGKTVGLVLCGGNIDTRLLANVLLRDLARSGRLARLRIRCRIVRARCSMSRASSIRSRSTSSKSITSASSQPAGQGPDHRYRMRDARPAHLDRLMARFEAGYEASPVELA